MGRPVADLLGEPDTLDLPLVDTNQTLTVHIPSMSVQYKLRMYHHPCVVIRDQLREVTSKGFRTYMQEGQPREIGEALLGDALHIYLGRACDGVTVIRFHPAKADLRAHF